MQISLSQTNLLQEAINAFHRSPFDTEDATCSFWIDLNSNAPQYVPFLETDPLLSAQTPDSFVRLISAADVTPDQILHTGTVQPGIGCLGRAVYSVPAVELSDGSLLLHSLGQCVMNYKSFGGLTPYIYTINTKQISPVPVDYLAFGRAFDILSSHFEEDEKVEAITEGIVSDTTDFILHICEMYTKKSAITTVDEATDFLSRVHGYLAGFPTLRYFYFEAVSLSLMLQSTDETSARCAAVGQLNNNLYIELTNTYHAHTPMQRFGSYYFQPDVSELQSLISEMIQSDTVVVEMDKLLVAIANNCIFYIATHLADPRDLRGMAYYDACLLGASDSSRQAVLENLISQHMSEYWKSSEIKLVYNSVIMKGEIGITPWVGEALTEIRVGEYDPSINYVHPTDRTLTASIDQTVSTNT